MQKSFNSGQWLRRGNVITVMAYDGSAAPAADRPLLELEGATKPVLRLGSTGAAVADLQSRLRAAGFDPGASDGVFGPQTGAAVRLFQRSRGLTVDAIVGAQTWGALASPPHARRGAQTPAAPPSAVPAGKLTLSSIQRALVRKGYVMFSRPYELNIVGVRSETAEPNRFDDSINVFFKGDSGKWTFESYPSTSDPGTLYLLEPLLVKGTAIVVPGQYLDSHQIGIHNRSYTALVQRGPITVVRDANLDNRLDFAAGVAETGLFGINIHRASQSGTTGSVGAYSAGCQVFASADDFARFMTWCQRHGELYGNSFTYTLLEERDL